MDGCCNYREEFQLMDIAYTKHGADYQVLESALMVSLKARGFVKGLSLHSRLFKSHNLAWGNRS